MIMDEHWELSAILVDFEKCKLEIHLNIFYN